MDGRSSSSKPLPTPYTSSSSSRSAASPSLGAVANSSPGVANLNSNAIPRPAPIPIPEPVNVDALEASVTGQSAEGAASTSSSSGSGPRTSIELGSTRYSPDPHSPASPHESNTLLAAAQTDHAPLTMTSRRARPTSISEPGAGTSGPLTSPPISRNFSSAADVYARPSSTLSLNPESHQYARSSSPADQQNLRPISATVRSRSSQFIPSPLNPNAIPRPNRPISTASRPASMVLYRLAGIGDEPPTSPGPNATLQAPSAAIRRASRLSTFSSTNSIYSMASDSKYPNPLADDGPGTPPPSGAFLAYEYDPSSDMDAPDDAEDELHRPDPVGTKEKIGGFNLRGFCNIFTIVVILLALLTLFLGYPLIAHFDLSAQSKLFTGGTGGSKEEDSKTSTRTKNVLIDPDTPDDVKTRNGFDGQRYELVFSDEFNQDDRSFKSGDDPFWEAVDLHDAKNEDLQYYESGQVTTRDGHLVIKIENTPTQGFEYKSGMLQSWNKLCFTSGYIEVSVRLPGSGSTYGLTPLAYTLGNLARAGYGASEDGVWPYSYNSCDVGINPNQTEADLSGPFAAQTGGDPRFNNELSWLSGQRLSSCTCSGEDHPNPGRGRGAPQIDLINVQSYVQAPARISQSVHFAPFNAQYLYPLEQLQLSGTTTHNDYRGLATEQVIGGIVDVPTDVYENDDAGFYATFGYEHFADPDNPGQGFITWSMDGTETAHLNPDALLADAETQIEARLIPEEPMSIVLGLSLSEALAPLTTTTSIDFPAEFLIDYVRVYQREGGSDVLGCSPSSHPTEDYIKDHENAYNDPSLRTWEDAGYEKPLNEYVDGCTA